MYVSMYLSMYVYVRIYVFMYVYMNLSMSVSMYVCCVRLRMCACAKKSKKGRVGCNTGFKKRIKRNAANVSTTQNIYVLYHNTHSILYIR